MQTLQQGCKSYPVSADSAYTVGYGVGLVGISIIVGVTLVGDVC